MLAHALRPPPHGHMLPHAWPPPRRGAYAMGMPETTGRWTREMVLALPDDGKRYELFDGELLVTPCPSHIHQRVVAAFLRRIEPYVLAHGLGEVIFSPADVPLDGEQVAQPDPFVIPPPSARPPPAWTARAHPLPAGGTLHGGPVAQPDLFVIPPPSARPPASWTELPNPILVLEVLSPSTARNDRVIKRRTFPRNRIPE